MRVLWRHRDWREVVRWSVQCLFFFSSRRRHTRLVSDWSSDVCSSDLVTLPAQATAASGALDGHAVTWILDHAEHTNTTEFADLAGRMLEASCPAAGLKLTPSTPPRLALGSFTDIPAGEVAAKGPGPDAEKVKASAKFVPYALQVTRTLDLSGEAGAQESQAQLIGALVLPHALAPQNWGSVTVEEVVDAKGNNLKSERDQQAFFSELRLRE